MNGKGSVPVLVFQRQKHYMFEVFTPLNRKCHLILSQKSGHLSFDQCLLAIEKKTNREKLEKPQGERQRRDPSPRTGRRVIDAQEKFTT